MRDLAYLLRTLWAAFGVVAGIVLVLATGTDAVIFALAYGSRAGSYAGQAGDRHRAWALLIWIAALWVFVLVAMLWPALRWRRQGRYRAPESPRA